MGRWMVDGGWWTVDEIHLGGGQPRGRLGWIVDDYGDTGSTGETDYRPELRQNRQTGRDIFQFAKWT